jgi:hypothetical protein
VAHICNPSYSGGRYLEDHGLKPANSSQDPSILKKKKKKKNQHKKGLVD